MAKSLFGKADSTLVNMALKEGLSNVPADMTEQYDAMGTTYGLTNKFLLEQANEMFSDINSANEEMLDVVNPIYEQLQDGTFTDADMMQFKGVLDTFRDEWKSIPKGKDGETQRMQWKSKVNKFNNGIKALDQDLNTITTMIANDQYVVGGADGVGGNTAAENMKFLTSIYNTKAGNEGNKATMSVENGEIFFTANIDGKEIKMSQPDIKKLIPVTDHDALSARDTILNNLKTVGKTKGTSYNDKTIKDTADSLYRAITYSNNSRDTFQTLAHTAYGEESFYQALHNPFSSLTDVIKKGLLNISLPDKFDVAGEKGIDEADFENIENFNQIKKYIMNNPRIGGRLLADWTAATDGTNAFNIGIGLRSVDNNPANDQYNVFGNYKGKVYGGITVPGSNTYVENKTRNNRRNEVMEIYLGNTKKDFFTGVFGQYDWKGNDTWEHVYNGETLKYNTFQVMDREAIYASTGEFEKGLSSSDSNKTTTPVVGGKEALSETDIRDITNIWEDNLTESQAESKINKILIAKGSPKRVTVPFAPGSKYKIRFDNEDLYVNNKSDLTRLFQLLGLEDDPSAQDTETTTANDTIAINLINKYKNPGFNFNKTNEYGK